MTLLTKIAKHKKHPTQNAQQIHRKNLKTTNMINMKFHAPALHTNVSEKRNKRNCSQKPNSFYLLS